MPYVNGAWYEDTAPIAPGFQAPYGSISDQSAAIATGMGETDPRARSVYDFAPIFDSALNRANSSGYVPYSYQTQMGGTDPIHSVFTSPRFGNSNLYQYDAWGNATGGAATNRMYEQYGGLGYPTSPGMTNAEIAYYGVYGPYGDLRGNSMGATSYLNPSVVGNAGHALGFLGQGGVPRDLSVFQTGQNNPYLRQMFNPQTSQYGYDTTGGVINATTGYFRDVYGGGMGQPSSVYGVPNMSSYYGNNEYGYGGGGNAFYEPSGGYPGASYASYSGSSYPQYYGGGGYSAPSYGGGYDYGYGASSPGYGGVIYGDAARMNAEYEASKAVSANYTNQYAEQAAALPSSPVNYSSQVVAPYASNYSNLSPTSIYDTYAASQSTQYQPY